MSGRYGLAIKVRPFIGETHREWAAHAVALANRLDCPVEVLVYEIPVTVFPHDVAEKFVEWFLELQKMVGK
jgi:hypothetical protein